jgi:hypothetical protein
VLRAQAERLLKGIYDRARPPGSLVATSGASFPSGHSIAASVTVMAAVIALVPAGRRRVWSFLAAVAQTALISPQREVQVLTRLIDGEVGEGQSIVLVGDPGIGRWPPQYRFAAPCVRRHQQLVSMPARSQHARSSATVHKLTRMGDMCIIDPRRAQVFVRSYSAGRICPDNEMTQSSRRSSWPPICDRICQATHEYALGQRPLFGTHESAPGYSHPCRGGWPVGAGV